MSSTMQEKIAKGIQCNKTNGQVNKTIYNDLLLESSKYHPIDLEKLDVNTVVRHLLYLTKNEATSFTKKKVKKKSHFLKSYGGHRSALTFLFTECKVVPKEGFTKKFSRAMAGLRKTAAKNRGKQGCKLWRFYGEVERHFNNWG